jgi:hypothetical protein
MYQSLKFAQFDGTTWNVSIISDYLFLHADLAPVHSRPARFFVAFM